MPYKVIAEEGGSVSILKKVGDWKTPQGDIIQEDHESVPRVAGEILNDDDVAPSVVALYDAGDPHVRSYLMRIDGKGKEVDSAPAKVLQAPEPGDPIPSADGEGSVKNEPVAKTTTAKATTK